MAFDGAAKPIVSAPDPDGTVVLTCGELELALRFSWAALLKLQGQFGHGEDFLNAVSVGLDQRSIDRLAFIAAAAANTSPEEILELSPPILPLSRALNLAWRVAWMGPGVELDFDEEAAPDAPEGKPRAEWLTALWRRLSRTASHTESSGG